MKVALILPAEGPEWGSVRAPNLGNAMICEATRRILKRLSSPYLKIEEFTYLKRPSPEELKRINSCDQAIFVGTNIFQPHTVGWEWQTEDLQQIKIPYWLYGVGYSGPLHSHPREICRATKDLIDWSSRAEAIGVRDPYTARWLKEQGVYSELIGCPVLAYSDAFSGITLGQGKPVLAVRQILLHNPNEEAVATQRVMIDWFFKEYPDGVCVVQEPADLKLLEGRPILTELNEIVQALSQARFVLSARLHAGMIALVLGRPVIFLAHDTRVSSFCGMVGLPSRELNFEGLKEAIHAIQRIKRGDLAEFNPALTRIPFFRERLERFLSDTLAEGGLKRESTREVRTRELLVQLQTDFFEAKQELTELQEQLQVRDRELVELRQKLEESQQRLIEVYSSLGWKFLDRYRRLVNLLLPFGTRRRLWYSRVLRAVDIVFDEGWGSLWRRLKARRRSKQLQKQDLEELFPLPMEWEQAAERDEKTRLLVLVPSMGAGGMERCTELLLRYFNRKLFDLHLAMIFDHEPFYQIPSDVKSYVLGRYRQPKVKICFDGLPPEVSAKYSDDLTWMEATAYKLGLFIRMLKPDVVLAQDFFAAIIALMARKYLPLTVKILVSAHNQYSGLMDINPKGGLYTILIQRYFNGADQIIAVSQGIAVDLIENFGVYPNIITVIHNPIDLVQIKSLAQEPITEHPWFREDVPIVLFVGRLTPQKGLTYLLQAAEKARKLEWLRIVLIGEGEQRQELEALAQQLGISGDVLFLGKQSNPFKFMRRAMCFVLPSVVEGLPYVIPEAMACGCPVIATDCAPGVREQLAGGQRGLLIPPKDPYALAEAILKVLWHDDLCERLTQAGLQYVDEFAADKIVTQYEDLVKKHASIYTD